MRFPAQYGIALAICTAACGEDEPAVAAGYNLEDLHVSLDTMPPVRYEVRDSAGVQLIRNGRDGPLPPELLKPREIYRVGVVMGDQDYELWAINAIAIDRDGNRYAGSSRSGWIRAYDPSGRLLYEFGRHGQGPGDLLYVSGLFFAGDTLVLVDQRLRRTTLFSRKGYVIDTWNALRPDMTMVWPVHFGPSGWIAHVVRPPLRGYEVRQIERTGETEIYPRHVKQRRFAAKKLYEERDSLYGYLPDQDSIGVWLFDVRHHPRYKTHDEVAGNRPMFVYQSFFGFDGSDRFYVTRPTGYRIDVFNSSGRHVRGITRDYRATPIDRGMVEELKRRVRSNFDTIYTGERRRTLDRTIEGIEREAELTPLPPLYPPLAILRVSEDGSFWVLRMDMISPVENRARGLGGWDMWPPLPSFWDVYDSESRFLGQVELPPRFSLMHVRGVEATGVQRDTLGVEYIVTYRIGPQADSLERRPSASTPRRQ